MDQSGRLTEVPFSERVCTFTCGRFSFGGGDTRNVLVYVTYRGKIFLDHRVEMIQGKRKLLQCRVACHFLRNIFKKQRRRQILHTRWHRPGEPEEPGRSI